MDKQTYILSREQTKKKLINSLRGADDKTIRIVKQYYDETESHIIDLEWVNIEQTQEHKKKIAFYRQRIRNYRLLLHTAKKYANIHARLNKRAK